MWNTDRLTLPVVFLTCQDLSTNISSMITHFDSYLKVLRFVKASP